MRDEYFYIAIYDDGKKEIIKTDVIMHAETLYWSKYNSTKKFNTEEEAIKFLMSSGGVKYYKIDINNQEITKIM